MFVYAGAVPEPQEAVSGGFVVQRCDARAHLTHSSVSLPLSPQEIAISRSEMNEIIEGDKTSAKKKKGKNNVPNWMLQLAASAESR